MAKAYLPALAAALALNILQADIPNYIKVKGKVTKSGAELILNGNFENGAANWTQSASIIGSNSKYKPYGGSKFALLGGKGKKKNMNLSQIVSIPADATEVKLQFQMYIMTTETSNSANDKLTVRVLDEKGDKIKDLITYSNINENSEYRLVDFDLLAFKGKKITLEFNCSEINRKQTSFIIDDVSVLYKGAVIPDPPSPPLPPLPDIPGLKTLYTTSVQDNLDASDKVDFTTGMAAFGYKDLGTLDDVNKQQLKALAERKDIGMLYHTGHGNEGTISTSTGNLAVADINKVNVEHFFIATCLTLVPTTWKEKFGDSCQSINGYTMPSYDNLDNQQVKKFLEIFQAKPNVVKAYYLSNAAFAQLSDRWCSYARTANGIVEFSARTKVYPTLAEDSLVFASNKYGQVKAAQALMNVSYSRNLFEGAGIPGSLLGLEEDAQSLQDFLPMDGVLKGADSDESADQAAADAFVSQHAVADAKLDQLIPVDMKIGDALKTTGHIARYIPCFNGLSVRSNGEDLHWAVFINNGAITGYRRHWAASYLQGKPSGLPVIENASDILAAAAPNLLNQIKGDVRIVDIQPCLGLRGQQLVPAYALVEENGAKLIVSAVTGEWL